MDPLSRYPAIHTSRVAEFERELIAIYGATAFELPTPSGLNVRGNFIQLDDIALGFGTCGTATRIWFAESDFARLQLPLRGRGMTTCGRASVEVRVGVPAVTSPRQPTVLEYGADFEQLFLRVSAAALEARLAALLGRPVRCDLAFEPSAFTSQQMLSGLQRLVELLAGQLNDTSALLSPLAVKELEQAVILQLLFASRHNLSGVLQEAPAPAGPRYLREAEAYIEANWNKPITVEALSEVAGVGVRALFRGFRKARGYSPMAFVKKLRLAHANRLLTKPDGGLTSVTGVALACGFSNLGHFAREYREAFGERPSETLQRSRSGRRSV